MKIWVLRWLRKLLAKQMIMLGDGTTTASILAQAIVGEGIKYVTAGMNPMDIKRGIDKAVENVIESKKNFKKS